MIKEAMEWIKEQTSAVEMLVINGEQYSNRNLKKVPAATRRELNTTTLTGVVDYIKSKFDGDEEFIITVENHKKVIVETHLNDNKSRETVLISSAQVPDVELNKFMDLERFNIQLQSIFVETDVRSSVLSLVGNIKNENVSKTGDDGVSQMVEVKRGVTLVQKEKVPNPVSLKPFRTFTEIAQPESSLVLRLKTEFDEVKAALFEADGGAWKNEAIINIKEYLEKELESEKERITILA